MNNLSYSTMFSVTTSAWADRCGDEFNQTIEVGGTLSVAWVIKTLSREMPYIELENFVYENSKPVITVIKS